MNIEVQLLAKHSKAADVVHIGLFGKPPYCQAAGSDLLAILGVQDGIETCEVGVGSLRGSLDAASTLADHLEEHHALVLLVDRDLGGYFGCQDRQRLLFCLDVLKLT